MSLTLTNTLGGRKEAFEPLSPGVLKMYHCGPTVKEPININKFRSYLLGDLLRRTFDRSGFEVQQVMNITDVGHLNEFEEDWVEIAAGRSGKQPEDLVEEELREFHEERRALRIVDAHEYPKAQENVPDMIALVSRLLEAGAAYRTEQNVYLDIGKFPDFGKLTGKSTDELVRLQESLVRKSAGDKRHPLDIDLWRTDITHQLDWPSPWGVGFPGWHIECVVMSQKYLGTSFDIHTGSEDIVFPHHECEIAQAEVLSGEPFARYWLHSAPVMLEGRPISRKNHNRLTIKALLGEGYSGVELRLALLGTHYRESIEFGPDTIESAQKSLGRLAEAVKKLEATAGSIDAGSVEAGADSASAERIEAAATAFDAALDDDLDYPKALRVVIDMAEDFASGKVGPAPEALDAVTKFDLVLGLL